MLQTIKRRLYFFTAHYFSFLARIVLARWKPTVIVVTGSAGKTTLLHLIEAQLGARAHYSHHANSAFGVPLDILKLRGIEQSRKEWIGLFLKAPFRVLGHHWPQKLYVVEADTDRPNEGKFLASLLKPHITLWVSVLHTHTAQFDGQVGSRFKRPEEAIAYEYGYLVEKTKQLLIMNSDEPLMLDQIPRTQAQTIKISMDELATYNLDAVATSFSFKNKTYKIPALLPRATYYQIAIADALLAYLNHEPDYTYSNFQLPPGRSNIFRGVKNTTIIDSTYNNSNFDSLKTVVEMFADYPAKKEKWAVIGDMLEQGKDEAVEHQKIAALLETSHFDRIILMGVRVKKYTDPLLSASLRGRCIVTSFENPAQVLEYLHDNLKGDETILFKGVRFLEGVIEVLLADKNDAKHLVRRGRMWQKRRKQWGLS